MRISKAGLLISALCAATGTANANDGKGGVTILDQRSVQEQTIVGPPNETVVLTPTQGPGFDKGKGGDLPWDPRQNPQPPVFIPPPQRPVPPVYGPTVYRQSQRIRVVVRERRHRRHQQTTVNVSISSDPQALAQLVFMLQYFMMAAGNGVGPVNVGLPPSYPHQGMPQGPFGPFDPGQNPAGPAGPGQDPYYGQVPQPSQPTFPPPGAPGAPGAPGIPGPGQGPQGPMMPGFDPSAILGQMQVGPGPTLRSVQGPNGDSIITDPQGQNLGFRIVASGQPGMLAILDPRGLLSGYLRYTQQPDGSYRGYVINPGTGQVTHAVVMTPQQGFAFYPVTNNPPLFDQGVPNGQGQPPIVAQPPMAPGPMGPGPQGPFTNGRPPWMTPPFNPDPSQDPWNRPPGQVVVRPPPPGGKPGGDPWGWPGQNPGWDPGQNPGWDPGQNPGWNPNQGPWQNPGVYYPPQPPIVIGPPQPPPVFIPPRPPPVYYPPQPRPSNGNRDVQTALVTTGLGVAIGAAVDDRKPVRGALIGGGIGLLTGILINEANRNRPYGYIDNDRRDRGQPVMDFADKNYTVYENGHMIGPGDKLAGQVTPDGIVTGAVHGEYVAQLW